MQPDPDLIKSIIHKHDIEGKGFRKTAKELGLKKSHVFNLYKKYAPQHKEQMENKMKEDPEYQRLKSFSVDLKQEVQHYEALQKQQREIEEMFTRKASTDEGLADILSSQGSLWSFASSVARKIDVWSRFLDACKSRKLEPGKTLFEVVGILTDFEYSIRQGGTPDLVNHIGLELEIWLDEAEDEEKQQALQRRFREFLINVKCLDCGEPLARRLPDGSNRLFVIEGDPSCFQCSTIHQMLCLKCKNPLEYKSDNNSFFCHTCELTYLLGTHIEL